MILFLEIKTPLHFLSMEIPKNIETKKTKLSPGNRLIKHFKDLQNYLKLNKRAIMVLIYMYDADNKRRETKENSFKYNEVAKESEECHKLGLETFQVNLKMNSKEIDVDKVFKL